jgi:hypothetical protein
MKILGLILHGETKFVPIALMNPLPIIFLSPSQPMAQTYVAAR